ncbi:MAG TPA: DUF5666 domain-containing protein [Thermoanaerobaculia bacterium]
MKRQSSFAGLAVMLLLLAAGCGSTGDIFGGGGNNDNTNRYGSLRGTVEHVDLNNQWIELRNVSGYQSMLSNGGGSGSTTRIYFDRNMSVDYNGQSYQVGDLERGDEVAVDVNEQGSQLVANRITVTRDITANGSTGNSGSYGSTIRGTVRYVDTSRRTVEVDRGYGSTVVVEYGTQTPVTFGGRTYGVGDLERGDEIEIRATDLGSGRMRADNITVVRSVSGNNSGSGTYGGSGTYDDRAVVRGTVRSIDTYNRTIELENSSWISGFNTNASTMRVQYGSNANVVFNGQSYPVTNLERGDMVEVEIDRSGSNYLANRITVVRDVRR